MLTIAHLAHMCLLILRCKGKETFQQFQTFIVKTIAQIVK